MSGILHVKVKNASVVGFASKQGNFFAQVQVTNPVALKESSLTGKVSGKQILGKNHTTHVCKSTLNPSWDSEFHVQVTEPDEEVLSVRILQQVAAIFSGSVVVCKFEVALSSLVQDRATGMRLEPLESRHSGSSLTLVLLAQNFGKLSNESSSSVMSHKSGGLHVSSKGSRDIQISGQPGPGQSSPRSSMKQANEIFQNPPPPVTLLSSLDTVGTINIGKTSAMNSTFPPPTIQPSSPPSTRPAGMNSTFPPPATQPPSPPSTRPKRVLTSPSRVQAPPTFSTTPVGRRTITSAGPVRPPHPPSTRPVRGSSAGTVKSSNSSPVWTRGNTDKANDVHNHASHGAQEVHDSVHQQSKIEESSNQVGDAVVATEGNDSSERNDTSEADGTFSLGTGSATRVASKKEEGAAGYESTDDESEEGISEAEPEMQQKMKQEIAKFHDTIKTDRREQTSLPGLGLGLGLGLDLGLGLALAPEPARVQTPELPQIVMSRHGASESQPEDWTMKPEYKHLVGKPIFDALIEMMSMSQKSLNAAVLFMRVRVENEEREARKRMKIAYMNHTMVLMKADIARQEWDARQPMQAAGVDAEVVLLKACIAREERNARQNMEMAVLNATLKLAQQDIAREEHNSRQHIIMQERHSRQVRSMQILEAQQRTAVEMSEHESRPSPPEDGTPFWTIVNFMTMKEDSLDVAVMLTRVALEKEEWYARQATILQILQMLQRLRIEGEEWNSRQAYGMEIWEGMVRGLIESDERDMRHDMHPEIWDAMETIHREQIREQESISRQRIHGQMLKLKCERAERKKRKKITEKERISRATIEKKGARLMAKLQREIKKKEDEDMATEFVPEQVMSMADFLVLQLDTLVLLEIQDREVLMHAQSEAWAQLLVAWHYFPSRQCPIGICRSWRAPGKAVAHDEAIFEWKPIPALSSPKTKEPPKPHIWRPGGRAIAPRPIAFPPVPPVQRSPGVSPKKFMGVSPRLYQGKSRVFPEISPLVAQEGREYSALRQSQWEQLHYDTNQSIVFEL